MAGGDSWPRAVPFVEVSLSEKSPLLVTRLNSLSNAKCRVTLVDYCIHRNRFILREE